MIEFKAECGHTVRAKDEDAGGVVRCSYCGKSANVPDPQGDELDFLFSDVQRQENEQPRRRRKQKKKAATKRKPGDLNPFAIVLRMCYAALLLIIVLVVGRKFVMPLFEEGGIQTVIKRTTPSSQVDQPKTRGRQPRRTPKPAARPGLISRNKYPNLYTTSTPSGAAIYCIQADRAPAEGRIYEISGCLRLDGVGKQRDLSDGNYIVEVVFPWGDRNLTRYPGYNDFRRSLQDADDAKRNDLLQRFFIPDEATDFFIHESDGQFSLVRQYRGVTIRNRRSRGVRALFLPRMHVGEDKGCSIEALVNNYISTDVNYSFDQDHVRSELGFYNVSESDQPFVLKTLVRIGIIPYLTSDGKLRLFKIDIDDGRFAAKLLHD